MFSTLGVWLGVTIARIHVVNLKAVDLLTSFMYKPGFNHWNCLCFPLKRPWTCNGSYIKAILEFAAKRRWEGIVEGVINYDQLYLLCDCLWPYQFNLWLYVNKLHIVTINIYLITDNHNEIDLVAHDFRCHYHYHFSSTQLPTMSTKYAPPTLSTDSNHHHHRHHQPLPPIARRRLYTCSMHDPYKPNNSFTLYQC